MVLKHRTAPRALAIAVALLVHGVAGWWLANPKSVQRSAPPGRGPVLELRLLPADPPTERATPHPTAPLAGVRRPTIPLPITPVPPVERDGVVEPAPTAAPAEPAPSLLDTDATARALREAGRAVSIGEAAAHVSGEPARRTAQERLGGEVEQAARGDCLKGEYAGAGMGLLSLPFLAAAVLADRCRH